LIVYPGDAGRRNSDGFEVCVEGFRSLEEMNSQRFVRRPGSQFQILQESPNEAKGVLQSFTDRFDVFVRNVVSYQKMLGFRFVKSSDVPGRIRLARSRGDLKVHTDHA